MGASPMHCLQFTSCRPAKSGNVKVDPLNTRKIGFRQLDQAGLSPTNFDLNGPVDLKRVLERTRIRRYLTTVGNEVLMRVDWRRQKRPRVNVC